MNQELIKIYEIEGYHIIEVEGYKSDEKYFYIPDDGYHLVEGVDAFLNENDAISQLKSKINEDIRNLKEIEDKIYEKYPLDKGVRKE